MLIRKDSGPCGKMNTLFTVGQLALSTQMKVFNLNQLAARCFTMHYSVGVYDSELSFVLCSAALRLPLYGPERNHSC